MTKTSDRYVEVPGGRLRVRDEGSGLPLLLIHAGIARLESWDAVATRLVAAGHRVVRHDMRSWGESTTEDVEFTHPADIVAVLDAVGVGRAVLVGNSMGGVHSFSTAVAYPERVAAVVGVGAGLAGFEPEVTPEEAELFAEMERLDEADPPDPDAIADIDVRGWVDGPGQRSGRAPAWIRETIREWDRELNRPDRVTGRQVRLDPPAGARLDELRCPVLAVAGSLDFSEVATTARRLADQAPDARAVIWDDVAHMIGMEQPDRLAEEILTFVAGLPPW
jgi:pimeloyl-ACP methyl ester carboxylesterase